ncbi:MAG: D-alanyl-D-alanine endopeptidase [Betaproteobacteria bacterium]|nr:D-alanyl-D-alanine endopeptidase [Betaproteobacteria bacterium]
METPQRQLHRLEKIVALCALVAVLALSFGFAQAEPRNKKQHAADSLESLNPAHPEKLILRSSVALVQDATSGETLLAKNVDAVLPIASITKLMTALVLLDRGVDMDARVAISGEDQDLVKGTRSRLRNGAVLTRSELLMLALMSSENRAAASLARTFPGGFEVFVAAMNEKARSLGMADSRFVDSTGLSSANVSSAQDLGRLVVAAYAQPLIREYSTLESAQVQVFGRPLEFRNTNGLVRSARWNIGLSKTGYISEAGRCLVMRARVAGKDLVVVLLDSWGKYSRAADANRIRKWLETNLARGHQG